MSPPVRRSAAGLRLVELLVALEIISLLAAVIFPVFAAARRRAVQVSQPGRRFYLRAVLCDEPDPG